MKALLIQADTTQTLPIARSLKSNGWKVGVVVSSKWTYGYGTRYADKKYVFRDYENIPEYYKFIMNILKYENYDIIIPMADHGAQMVSKYKNQLLELTKFVMPDYEQFQKGYDKHLLMAECERLGLPHPKTISVKGNSLPLEKIGQLKFPVLIKPNQSSGARGITFIKNLEELELKFESVYNSYGECHIQEFIPEGGHQVKVQLYVNENGVLIQSSAIRKFRWYPSKGGSSCCNESYENHDIIEKCYLLLKSIGWVGFADFDTIEDSRTGELLIMELNPRVPACIKTVFEAGIDWADVISSEYTGISHRSYDNLRHVYLRHLGFEILWFLNSKNKFDTTPSWFKFIGNNIYYQDMNGIFDPMPFIRGTIGNVAKQLSPSFRKTKSGI